MQQRWDMPDWIPQSGIIIYLETAHCGGTWRGGQSLFRSSYQARWLPYLTIVQETLLTQFGGGFLPPFFVVGRVKYFNPAVVYETL